MTSLPTIPTPWLRSWEEAGLGQFDFSEEQIEAILTFACVRMNERCKHIARQALAGSLRVVDENDRVVRMVRGSA